MDHTFWSDVSSPPPQVISLSTGSGLLGTDRGFSIDLRPGTGIPAVLWTFGDVFLATGIGQNRTVPSTDDSLHNIVAVQSGGTYDLSKDTLQWSLPNLFPVPAGAFTVNVHRLVAVLPTLESPGSTTQIKAPPNLGRLRPPIH